MTERVGGKEGRGVQKGTEDTNRININDFLPLEHFIAFAFLNTTSPEDAFEQ